MMMNTRSDQIRDLVDRCGGVSFVAHHFKIGRHGVYCWYRRGLPRKHVGTLSRLSNTPESQLSDLVRDYGRYRIISGHASDDWRRRPLEERLESKIIPEPNTGCWLWIGATTNDGYGHLKIDGRMQKAHRVVYELAHGNIGDDLVIDHLCRVRCCVNPDHLEPVTNAENIRRGNTGENIRDKTNGQFSKFGEYFAA